MTIQPVRQYSGADAPVQALTRCVSQAFDAYNGWTWLMGEYAGTACSAWLLEAQISSILSKPAARAYAIPISCDGDVVGVSAVAFLSSCQTAAPPPAPGLLERAKLAWNLGPRIALRLSEFNAAVAELHAQDAAAAGAHFKISFVGVLPHMQGRGQASRVLRALLETVDSAGLPCYLFTANDRNEAMYAKLGFVARSRRSMGPIAAGPYAGEEMVIRSMLRPAAPQAPVIDPCPN